MSAHEIDRTAWITASACALNRNGSWTGRIHIHKHLFVAQVLKLTEPPFAFELYDYGPYSFDLDAEIINLELTGFVVRSYPRPGFGPRYQPTAQGLERARLLPQCCRNPLENVATQFGESKSQELELIATCLWMERVERVSEYGRIVARVSEAKPKYREQEIQRALKRARSIADSLCG